LPFEVEQNRVWDPVSMTLPEEVMMALLGGACSNVMVWGVPLPDVAYTALKVLVWAPASRDDSAFSAAAVLVPDPEGAVVLDPAGALVLDPAAVVVVFPEALGDGLDEQAPSRPPTTRMPRGATVRARRRLPVRELFFHSARIVAPPLVVQHTG
jgi:hypothetical protein